MSSETESPAGQFTPVVVHLSGRYRGTMHRLSGDSLRIGIAPDSEIRFSLNDLTPGLSKLPESGPYAILERHGDTYELHAAEEADIWVNGVRTEHVVLASGDVIEIGQGGPVLRFRLHSTGTAAYKSVADVFSDCAHCARHSRNAFDRAGILIAGPPMELLTKTSPLVRIVVASFLVLLVVGIGGLWVRNLILERRLEEETQFVRGLADLLERNESAFRVEDLDRLRKEMTAQLSTNLERIAALEARAGARKRVIDSVARSVVFLQGAYGLEGADGKPLRFVGIGPDGSPLRGPFGEPRVTVEGDGPVLEIPYTGTGFVASRDGYLFTNRHVALPWEFDPPAQFFVAQGFEPVMRRFIGYLPEVAEPFEVTLVRASEDHDVALLECEPLGEEIVPLELATDTVRVGDEVIVMGYPTGMQALMARTDPEVVRELIEAGPPDFWELARKLAEGGHIAPLATVGVVGQITSGAVVYDAETTHGGSGGPVLDLDGRVLAVNAAIVPEFGGSNLGVPAKAAWLLLSAGDD
ncbi:MAG: trypsin-like peptidase domain-containing protein [Acidobacteriota bacterium]|nr:trypsin-like peptidase domain-containing protein [Acidobacteriota bacterium]